MWMMYKGLYAPSCLFIASILRLHVWLISSNQDRLMYWASSKSPGVKSGQLDVLDVSSVWLVPSKTFYLVKNIRSLKTNAKLKLLQD